MRLAAYAGFSTAAAVAVLLRAFHERPNFYSASVYLSQSNACLMVLTNLILLAASLFLYGLQRLLFGPLRPIEVEQLYEKAWFAVTETCLAMTIFREEVGAWFLVMFVCLLFGKVWGWIGEGRVEFLEQQPPSNPRLFHARLSISLLLSMTFNTFMLNYCISTVLVQARPGMMVMFAFEFAVLLIASVSTTIRYTISLVESYIVWKQTQERLQQRRAEVQAANEEASRRATEDHEEQATPAQRPEDITEDDIEVPGWEEKGRYIFFLDLTTDFFKLVVYSAFFFILMFFHGIPIHIMRDVYMTARSFMKRIIDFLKYRQATKDMNERYPDATAEELGRESTCIICREDMRSWQPAAPAPGQAPAAPQATPDERLRPKKLPCGHVLHLGCLRSWLERQQVCPTCRRPVLVATAPPQPGAGADPNQQRAPNTNQAQNQNQQQNNQNRIRRINLGPLNLQFGVFPDDQWPNVMQQLNRGQRQAPAPAQNGQQRNQISNNPTTTHSSVQSQLRSVEQQILQEVHSLNLTHQQLSTVLALQGELARLRIAHSRLRQDGLGEPSLDQTLQQPAVAPQYVQLPVQQPVNMIPPTIQAMAPTPQQAHLGAGNPELPEGLVLPPGWTALPLQPLGATQPSAPPVPQGPTPTQSSGIAQPSTTSNIDLYGPNATYPETSAQPTPSTSTPRPQQPTATSHPENSNREQSSSAAEDSANKTPWANSRWGFENGDNGAGSNTSGSSSTRPKPASVEEAPDADAGPSH